jgi:PAS domain S-box-containing protein
MLEDKKEEAACLHVLGLLPDAEDLEFTASLESDAVSARTVREFRDSLTNLHLTTTVVKLPPPGAKDRLFARVQAEPSRVATDADGYIISINPSFSEMCGYRLHELVGKKPGHVLQGPGTCADAIRSLREAVAEGRACDIEMMNYHKNGSPYWSSIHIDPVRDANDKISGFEAMEKNLPMPEGLATGLRSS